MIDRKYTIHTENKNLKSIKNLLDMLCVGLGYTLVPCEGRWKGKREKSLKIEIISQNELHELIPRIAIGIRDLNNQDAVLVTVQNVEAELF